MPKIYRVEIEKLEEWEKRGRYIDVEAKNVNDAISKAKKSMIEDEEIFQITLNGSVVYDFFNGTSIYDDN